MWTYSYAMMEHESSDKKIKFSVSTTSTGTPRVIDGFTHKTAIQEGAGEGYEYLADEKYFTKYWHLLPSDMYNPCNIMEQVYNHTQDTSIGIHANKLKAEAGAGDDQGLRQKAKALHGAADTLEQALSDDSTAQGKVTELKDAASKVDPPNDKGLKELLDALNNASGLTELVSQAQKVLGKYNDVESKYNAVKNDSKAGKAPKFGDVTSAFNALQTEFYMIKRLDKFHPLRLCG